MQREKRHLPHWVALGASWNGTFALFLKCALLPSCLLSSLSASWSGSSAILLSCALQPSFLASTFSFCHCFLSFFVHLFCTQYCCIFLFFCQFFFDFNPIAKIRADQYGSARSNRAAPKSSKGPAGGSWPRAQFFIRGNRKAAGACMDTGTLTQVHW